MSVDQWDFWNRALAGEKPEPPSHPGEALGTWDVSAESLRSGFWRFNNQAIAIWRDDAGALFVLRDGMPAKAAWACGVWPRMYREAVTKEVYDAVLATGLWPDSPPPIGHNLPTDPFERINAQLRDESDMIQTFLSSPITTKEEADKAASWADRVAKLAKEADEFRVAEKRPHDDAAAEVQRKWKPLVDAGDALKRSLKKAVEPYLIAQQKAEAECRAAAAQENQPVVPIQNAAAGRIGSKVALRTVTKCEVTDIAALAAYLAAMNNPPPDFMEACKSAAFKVLRAGVDVPGAKLITSQQAA